MISVGCPFFVSPVDRFQSRPMDHRQQICPASRCRFQTMPVCSWRLGSCRMQPSGPYPVNSRKERLGDSLWSRHRPPTAGSCPEPVSPDAVDPVPVPWPLSFRLGSSVNTNHWVPVPAVSHPGFLKIDGDQNEAATQDPQNRRYTVFPFRDLRTAKNRKPPALAFRFSGNGLPAGGFFLLSLFQ